MKGNLVLHGLYKVNGQYFVDFKNPYWVDNKNEKRPYYYLFKDSGGVDWMIPLSTQVENYRKKIANIETAHGAGKCIYYHIAPIAGIDRVFLIGDMFPISSKYVKEPFTIKSVPYVLKDSNVNKVIRSKAMKFIKLVSTGKIRSRNNILAIKKKLIQDNP